MTTSGILLDTHAWLWWSDRGDGWRPAVQTRLAAAVQQQNIYIASITLMEMANMVRKQRVDLSMSLNAWFSMMKEKVGAQALDLTTDIAVEIAQLPADFHGDPADRVIAATARVHGLTLCTHDRRLLQYGKQGLFSTLEI